MELTIDKVHTEYEYPEQIGFVRSRYDLFAEDEARRIIVAIQHVKEQVCGFAHTVLNARFSPSSC